MPFLEETVIAEALQILESAKISLLFLFEFTEHGWTCFTFKPVDLVPTRMKTQWCRSTAVSIYIVIYIMIIYVSRTWRILKHVLSFFTDEARFLPSWRGGFCFVRIPTGEWVRVAAATNKRYDDIVPIIWMMPVEAITGFALGLVPRRKVFCST